MIFLVFDETVTDRPTDRRTDSTSYRDARTHLTIVDNFNSAIFSIFVVQFKDFKETDVSQKQFQDPHVND